MKRSIPELIQDARTDCLKFRAQSASHAMRVNAAQDLAKDIPRESIRSGVIDANYVIDYQTPEGASVEIPNRANIGQLLSYVFWLN